MLEELGVKLDIDAKKITECMEKSNIGFMFAPNHHPAMKYVGPVRQKLKIRTIFNILGPLSNPANVKKQLLGVFDKKWIRPMAETLKNLGSQRALLVNGSDGFDELTTTGISYVAELNNNKIKTYEINPEDLGIKLSNFEDLIGGNPEYNAKKIMNLLDGEKGPYRDIVLLNSAAALYVDGKVEKYAYGGVVKKPTLFPMANGIGLMGEAGAEAILPLRRGSNGKLGVQSTGGGIVNINVNVDASGSSVEGSEQGGRELGRAIAVAIQSELVKQKRPGGLLA